MALIRINTRPMVRFAERFASAAAHRVGAERAAVEHVRLTDEVFENQGQPLGQWPNKAVPDNPPKKGPKRRLDPTPRLQDTGALRNSIDYDVTDRGYNLGPGPLPYAAAHQFGARITMSPGMRRVLRGLGFRPRRETRFVTIPARPYLGVADDWYEILGLAYLSARVGSSVGG